MKKLLLAVVLAALVLAPAAFAKELQSISVCGPEDCNSSSGVGSGSGGAAFEAFRVAFEGESTATGAPATVLDAVPAGEFYKLGMLVRGDHPGAGRFSVEMWYVKPNLIRFLRGGYPEPFKRVGPVAAALLQRLAEGVRPYPAPKAVGAYVNGKRAARPAAYAALFSGLASTEAKMSSNAKWIDVTVMPDRANPWFTADMQFLYMPSEQALFFDKPVKVEYDLASAIARDGGLPLPPEPDGSSWLRVVAIGILGTLLVGAAALLLLRRRPHDAKRAQPTTA
jgi:hypothetical protein